MVRIAGDEEFDFGIGFENRGELFMVARFIVVNNEKPGDAFADLVGAEGSGASLEIDVERPELRDLSVMENGSEQVAFADSRKAADKDSR